MRLQTNTNLGRFGSRNTTRLLALLPVQHHAGVVEHTTVKVSGGCESGIVLVFNVVCLQAVVATVGALVGAARFVVAAATQHSCLMKPSAVTHIPT